MIEVLEKAYQRTLGLKKDLVAGDPYEVIPLKDRKCARDTTEVYLSRRGIHELANFEHFLNLEVVWLNGNKLRAVTGLDENFRIKELYLHDNQIKTLDGSIEKLLHLRTVTLYNNELSDLDHTLTYFKGLPYLVHLELFDNPLSEEQHYRRRVVHGLKRLQLFDRHKITEHERIATNKFFEIYNQPVKPKQRHRLTKVHEMISPGEAAVMKQAAAIERRNKLAEYSLQPPVKLREGASVPLQRKAPLNSTYELMEQGGLVRPDRITDWEKANFEKIFRTMDDFAKTKTIKRESLQKLWDIMEKDETYLGKIPEITKEEFNGIVSNRLKEKKELSYLTFRLLLDEFPWKLITRKQANNRADKLYQTANDLLRVNKDADALNECIKAIGLTKHF